MDDYKKCTWESIKNLYENSLQKGETFSEEIQKDIKNELEKMIEECETFIKNKEKMDNH